MYYFNNRNYHWLPSYRNSVSIYGHLMISGAEMASKIEKVPRDIRGEKSRKAWQVLENWSIAPQWIKTGLLPLQWITKMSGTPNSWNKLRTFGWMSSHTISLWPYHLTVILCRSRPIFGIPWRLGELSRECVLRIPTCRKRRLNGSVSWNNRIKSVAPCRWLDGHV